MHVVCLLHGEKKKIIHNSMTSDSVGAMTVSLRIPLEFSGKCLAVYF